uniref:Uncharacterized protein n=1 Tax=Micrurus lemniscatus lemniscatus TaxID=129467 RepID=A0A2D4IWT5_MICLE
MTSTEEKNLPDYSTIIVSRQSWCTNTSIFAASLRGEGSKSSDLQRVKLNIKAEALLAIPQLSNTQENLSKHVEFIMRLRTLLVNRTMASQSKGLLSILTHGVQLDCCDKSRI